jgi:hypothetical protein
MQRSVILPSEDIEYARSGRDQRQEPNCRVAFHWGFSKSWLNALPKLLKQGWLGACHLKGNSSSYLCALSRELELSSAASDAASGRSANPMTTIAGLGNCAVSLGCHRWTLTC